MMLFAFASLSNAQTCTTPTFNNVKAQSKAWCNITVNITSGSATCGAIYVEPVHGSGVYVTMNTPPTSNPANPAFVRNDPTFATMQAVVPKSYTVGNQTYQLDNQTNFYFTGYCIDGTETLPSAIPAGKLKFKGN